MQNSQTIADFTGAVEAIRAELNSVNVSIEEAEEERRQIANAPPHTDDIAAAFLSGLRYEVADFERQFASHLKGHFTGSDGDAATAAAKGRTADFLRMEAQKPDQEAQRTRAMRKELPALNIAVLAYLLRDSIEAEVPALVDRLCPAARNGIKAADRGRTLDELDSKLAQLRSQANGLKADLDAARRAVLR
jgi:hypothetical protein